jgi:hypothetical protein
MKPRLADRKNAALTLTEVLVVITVLLVLAVLFLLIRPTTDHRAADEINCLSNLRQIGISFRIWGEDRGGDYPMQMSITNGGAMELIATGNVAACFQVMSNVLANPRILICPADVRRQAAPDFGAGFGRQKISYFIGLDALDTQPQTMLSGDDNLMVNSKRVQSGILNLHSNDTLAWTGERHHGVGNILLGDGSAQETLNADLTSTARLATNRLAIP